MDERVDHEFNKLVTLRDTFDGISQRLTVLESSFANRLLGTVGGVTQALLPRQAEAEAFKNEVKASFQKDTAPKDIPRCLDIKRVREDYRRSVAIHRGYAGLCLYLGLVLIYVYCIAHQHDARSVGDVNGALQAFFDKQKSDLAVTDAKSLQTFMSKKIIPQLMQNPWSHVTSSGKRITGHTTNDYFHLVGGLVLTVKKSPHGKCFHHQECYGDGDVDTPFYYMRMPTGNRTLAIPYNHHFGGYSLIIPSSGHPDQIQSLISAYDVLLFGPDTRDVSVHLVLFNPSGSQTLTFLEYKGSITFYNHIDFTLSVTTIPYCWYPPGTMKRQVAIELVLLAIFLHALVRPILKYLFGKVNEDEPAEVEAWIESWSHLPQYGGRPILTEAVVFMFLGLFALCAWLYLGFLYSTTVTDFTQSHWLFEDFSQAAADDLNALVSDALHSMHVRALPLVDAIDAITYVWLWYFNLQVMMFFCILWRINEFLSFQKYLSSVTDTFHGIAEDLTHIGLVMVLVCFVLGVINYLAAGEKDQALQDVLGSFEVMIEVTFDIFKPGSYLTFMQLLTKYSPHVLRTDANINWLPYLLVIAFKVMVPMLLMKLLLGVIMEAYKKSTIARKNARPVREDLIIMFNSMKAALFHKGKGVPFIHVALAIAYHERRLDADAEAWRRHYLGIDSNEPILEALNALFSDKAPAPPGQKTLPEHGPSKRMKEIVKKHKLKPVNRDDVEDILWRYGMNRQRARIELSMNMCEDAEVKEEKDLKLQRRDSFRQTSEDVTAQMKDSHADSLRLLDADTKKEFLKSAEILFYFYDFYRIGTVNIRCVSIILRKLGFHMSSSRLSRLLAKYDDDGDGNFSFREFCHLMHDDAFIGHLRLSEKRQSSIRDQRCQMSMPSSSSLLKASATTPLLS